MTVPIVAQFAIPAVLEGIKTGLSRLDHPAAAGVTSAIATLQTTLANGTITPEQLANVNAALQKRLELEANERATTITQVNETARAEVASTDAYVRRMRPTFGYMMAVTWGAQMMAVAYVIVTDPAHAGDVISAFANLGMIWSIALSVMGIYVYQRSAEKIAGVTGAVGLHVVSEQKKSENHVPVYNN